MRVYCKQFIAVLFNEILLWAPEMATKQNMWQISKGKIHILYGSAFVRVTGVLIGQGCIVPCLEKLNLM
jgi:hypothetical protein